MNDLELDLDEYQESGFTEITEDQIDPPQAEPEQPIAPERGANSIISAQFAAEIIDVVFPGLIQVGFGLMGRKVRMQDLKASRFEKDNMIIPTLEDYLKTIDVSNVSPLEKLLICLATVYGVKAVATFPNAEKVQRGNNDQEVKVERRGRPRKTV